MAVRRKDSNNKVLRAGESQRADGRYVYRYSDVTGKRHSIYAKDLNELRIKENEVQFKLNHKLDLVNGNVSLYDYADNWLNMKHNVCDNTKHTYRAILKSLKETELGNMILSEIKPTHIKNYLNDLVLEGTSYGYIHLKYTLIKLVFADAVVCEVIKTSPCSIKLSSIVKRDKKKNKFLTKREEEELLEFVKYDYDFSRYYLMIYFMLNTGLRIGEVGGLTWNDIDFKDGSIQISRQVLSIDKVVRVTAPKSESANRTIYISEQLSSMLAEHKKRPRKIEPILDGYSGFVFLTPNNQPFFSIRFDNILLNLERKYKKETGNDITHLTPHVFRHTYCSRLIEKNIPPKIVQYIMGHSDITTTMDIYAHLEQQTIREKMSLAW